MNNQAIARILASQDGVITMKQAVEAGMSEHSVQRRLASTEWLRLVKGVYLASGHPRSHRTRLRTAVLSAGKGATAHGLTAAWWHGLVDTPPARPLITVPLNRTIQRTGVTLRRRDLPADDIEAVRGIAVTRISLTVLEVNDSVLIDRALQTSVSIESLQKANDRNRDRRGYAATTALLKVAESGGRSEAERLLHRLIRHVPGWSGQCPVNGFNLDADSKI